MDKLRDLLDVFAELQWFRVSLYLMLIGVVFGMPALFTVALCCFVAGAAAIVLRPTRGGYTALTRSDRETG